MAYRTAKGGVTASGKVGVLGRSSLSDWDLFFLGAASKLVATGGTYPYVSSFYFEVRPQLIGRLSSNPDW